MVRWTAHAKKQLRCIYNYIAQGSPLYANRVSEALVQKTLRLDKLPRAGRKVPELSDDAVREVSLYSYRIIYQIKAEHVDILAIIHKRRNMRSGDIPRT